MEEIRFTIFMIHLLSISLSFSLSFSPIFLYIFPPSFFLTLIYINRMKWTMRRATHYLHDISLSFPIIIPIFPSFCLCSKLKHGMEDGGDTVQYLHGSMYLSLTLSLTLSLSLVMTSIAQLIKASEYACSAGTRFKPLPCFWMNFQSLTLSLLPSIFFFSFSTFFSK